MPRTILTASNGNGYVFDGSTSFINTGTLGTLFTDLSSGSISFSWWGKTSTSTGALAFFGYRNGASTSTLLLQTNLDATGGAGVGKINLFVRDDSNVFVNVATTNSVGMNDGTYHHYCITLTPSTGAYQWYVDGVAVATTIQSVNTPTNWATPTGSALYIGARNSTGTANQFLPGTIDDFRIHNVYLSAAEVAAIKTGEIVTRGLVRLYRCDANQGGKCPDDSVNHLDGTNTGITLATGAIPLYRLPAL